MHLGISEKPTSIGTFKWRCLQMRLGSSIRSVQKGFSTTSTSKRSTCSKTVNQCGGLKEKRKPFEMVQRLLHAENSEVHHKHYQCVIKTVHSVSAVITANKGKTMLKQKKKLSTSRTPGGHLMLISFSSFKSEQNSWLVLRLGVIVTKRRYRV